MKKKKAKKGKKLTIHPQLLTNYIPVPLAMKRYRMERIVVQNAEQNWIGTSENYFLQIFLIKTNHKKGTDLHRNGSFFVSKATGDEKSHLRSCNAMIPHNLVGANVLDGPRRSVFSSPFGSVYMFPFAGRRGRRPLPRLSK